jgi:DnaK suppressor protein
MAVAARTKSASTKGKQHPVKSASKQGSVKSSARTKKAGASTKTVLTASSARKPAPVAKKPVAKKPVAKKPVAKKPVAKKPVTKKPVTKKPVTKKPVTKKPAVKKAGILVNSQEQTVLSQDRLPELRKSLIRKKEAILKEAKEEIAKYISGDNKQLVDTANDDGDWAQVDISEDLSLQRLSSHRKLMHDIDEAVRKIGEGTYGICEECGEEISEKRLLVIPTATLCVDCQEQKEQLEEFESIE